MEERRKNPITEGVFEAAIIAPDIMSVRPTDTRVHG